MQNMTLTDYPDTQVTDFEFLARQSFQYQKAALMATIAELISAQGVESTLAARIDAVEGSPMGDDSVTNAKLANMAQNTLKGRWSAGSGDPEDITIVQLTEMMSLPSTEELARNARARRVSMYYTFI